MRFDQLSSQSTRAASACAIALGFTIPISVAADNILLSIILLLWLVGNRWREGAATLHANRVAQAAIALFLLLAIGILWGSQPADGLRMLGKFVDLAFVPVFVSLFVAERARRHAAAALTSSLLLTLCLSSLLWAGLWPDNWLAIGTAREPEIFKKYLTQSVLLAIGAYMFALFALDAPTNRARAFFAIAALLCVANVTLMLSGRSGQLVLAALAMYFAFARWRWRGLLVMVLAFFVLALSIGTGGWGVRGGTAQSIADSTGLRDGSWTTVPRDFKAWQKSGISNTSTGQRLDYAINSATIVIAHPLTGVGTGGFAAAYARQVKGTGSEATVNPHNEFLNIAVQLGLPGLALLVLLLAVGWQCSKGLPTLLERDLARGLIIAYAVGCMINSMLMDHVEGLFFAWALGVLFGGWRTRSTSARQCVHDSVHSHHH